MSGNGFKHFLSIAGRLGLALLLTLTLANDGLAQGRRKRKKKKKKAASAKKDYPKATLILERGRLVKDVEIREIKFEKVEYRVRGSRRNEEVKGEKLVDIRYDDPPPLFASGVSRVRAGLYKRAVQSFSDALEEMADDDWFKIYATMWRGEAKLLAGDAAEAVTDFEAALAIDGEHFLVPNCYYGLGRAYTAQKNMGKAKEAFNKMSEKYGRSWGAKAKLGLGDCLLADGKATEARAAYNLAGSRASNRDERLAAKVGEGKCLVLKKQWDRAESTFEQIANEPGVAPEVVAMAWVGMGDCRFAQAEERNNDKALLKQALIAYQTCVVRFAGVPKSYPKALFRSAELYETLGQAKLAEYQRKELKSRCPNSSWTAKLK